LPTRLWGSKGVDRSGWNSALPAAPMGCGERPQSVPPKSECVWHDPRRTIGCTRTNTLARASGTQRWAMASGAPQYYLANFSAPVQPELTWHNPAGAWRRARLAVSGLTGASIWFSASSQLKLLREALLFAYTGAQGDGLPEGSRPDNRWSAGSLLNRFLVALRLFEQAACIGHLVGIETYPTFVSLGRVVDFSLRMSISLSGGPMTAVTIPSAPAYNSFSARDCLPVE